MANQQSLDEIIVAMVPLQGQSHLNSVLNLSRAIATYGIKVHYIATSLQISQLKSRATNSDTNTNPNPNPNPNHNIIFHEIPTPDFPSPPPDKTLSHVFPSLQASLGLRDPMTCLLGSLSAMTRRLVIVHDPLMSAVVRDACALPNAESYLFNCVSAVATFGIARDTAGEKGREDVPSSRGCLDAECQAFLDGQFESLKAIKTSGHLRNTCRVIESEFLELLEEREGESFRQWAIGPLESVTMFKNNLLSGRGKRFSEWLNRQEPKSVLYVSFGTTTFMEEDQIRELAIGLEESGTKFIWVLRDADKANIFDEVEVRRPNLPLGFEEIVEREGLGVIVRDWAPQLEILGHPSTGGFMSHCGWNSCLESLSLGVPVLAWPMYGDQPMNAALVVNMLKAGFDVREWAKKDELVSSSVIAEVVKRLMKSEEGDRVKKRAEELGCELRKSTEKGGVSRLELDSFVAHITRV